MFICIYPTDCGVAIQKSVLLKGRKFRVGQHQAHVAADLAVKKQLVMLTTFI